MIFDWNGNGREDFEDTVMDFIVFNEVMREEEQDRQEDDDSDEDED